MEQYTLRNPLRVPCGETQEFVIRCDSEDTDEEFLNEFARGNGYTYDWETVFYKCQWTGENSDEYLECQVVFARSHHIWDILLTKKEIGKGCLCRNRTFNFPKICIGEQVYEIPFIFACHDDEHDVQSAMLVIDLGNSRSCALVCDDVQNQTHQSRMKLQQLPLVQYYMRSFASGDVGIFDSTISFAASESRASFVNIGSKAQDMSRVLSSPQISPSQGDFFLSSPKKYFWDTDATGKPWKVLNRTFPMSGTIRFHA